MVAVSRIVALAAAAALLVACTRVSTDPGATIVREVHDPLPALQGEGLRGESLSTDDLAGDVLVLNAWATWCQPCEQEQPDLVTVANSYADRGVVFLGIDHQDGVAAAREWVRRFDVPYPSISDRSGRIAADLGYVGLPDTYVVDATGTIRYAINGATTTAQLSELLDRVLQSAPATASASASASASP